MKFVVGYSLILLLFILSVLGVQEVDVVGEEVGFKEIKKNLYVCKLIVVFDEIYGDYDSVLENVNGGEVNVWVDGMDDDG